MEELELTLEEKLMESEDKYLRLYADYENFKKRSNKEKSDIILKTKIDMLSSILDIDNDISIAIKLIKDESAREGVELISTKLHNFLHKQGIESVQTDEYDSELHDVVGVTKQGGDKIISVTSKGYSLDGKIFRHPKVILG